MKHRPPVMSVRVSLGGETWKLWTEADLPHTDREWYEFLRSVKWSIEFARAMRGTDWLIEDLINLPEGATEDGPNDDSLGDSGPV